MAGISSAQARLSKAAAYDSDDEGSQADMMTAGNAVLEGHLVIPLLQCVVATEFEVFACLPVQIGCLEPESRPVCLREGHPWTS